MSTVSREITPAELRDWLSQGDTTLVDVREPFEHAAASIEESTLVPLASLDPAALAAANPGRIVFHCKSGKRSADALTRTEHEAPGARGRAYSLAGGMDAWKREGHPVNRSASAPKIDVMRQVQITAGSLVVAGTLLGAFVHPAWLGLSGFVGAGLVFAGTTGFCGMAKVLAVLPWNKAPAPAGTANA